MAYLCYEGELLRNLWPVQIQQLRGPESATDVSAQLLVPEEQEHMHSWARILANPNPLDMYHKRALLSIPPVVGGPLQQVALHVQGFVSGQGLCLGTLGNWSGSRDTASKARQTLTLLGGNFPEVFKVQQDALTKLVKYCALQLGPGARFDIKSTRLVMERPVFIRKKAKQSHITLTPSDDPEQAAARISDQWVITHRLGIGKQDPNTMKITQCSPSGIQPGDFVDATIVLSIVTNGLRQNRHQISFDLERVVRLCPKHLVPRIQKEQPDDPNVVAAVKTMGHDFEWDEAHADVCVTATTTVQEVPMRRTTSAHVPGILGNGNVMQDGSDAGGMEESLERMVIDIDSHELDVEG